MIYCVPFRVLQNLTFYEKNFYLNDSVKFTLTNNYMKIILHFIVLLLLPELSIGQTGITWNPSIDVTAGSYGNDHPRIVTVGSGNPALIWGKASTNECYFSRWNGSSFSTPVLLNPSFPVFTASWAGPDIAAKGDTIYVVFKQTPEATNPAYIVSSFDGGLTFSSPVQVDSIAPEVSRFPTVTIDENGNPIVAYMHFDQFFSDAQWYVCRSNDLGQTFNTGVHASSFSGGEVCDCCPGGIVAAGNSVAMMYRNNNSNVRDSWIEISTDTGNSFTSGLNIDQNNWIINACPSTGPDGIVNGDSLYAVFMNAASGNPKVYWSRTSLSTNQTTGGEALSNGINQNYPRVSESGNALAIVWREEVGAEQKALLRFTTDVFSGLNAAIDTVAPFNVENADVAIVNGNVYVVWESQFGGMKFRSGSYTASTGITDNGLTQNALELFPNPVTGNQLRFLFGNSEAGSFEYSIFDHLGQEVANGKDNLSNGKATINARLENGVYLLKVHCNGRNIIKRFMKL